MLDSKPEARGVMVGLGGLAVVFAFQVSMPITLGLAHLYPVAILGALWARDRWPAMFLGVVATCAVLIFPAVAPETAAIVDGMGSVAGLIVAIWLTVLALLLYRRHGSRADDALLRRSFENLPAGLVVYDGADRMVLCNATNKALYPAVADLMVPGVSFEEMVRATAARNLYRTDEAIDDFVRQRIDRHRTPGPPHTQTLSDGRRLLIQETGLKDGSTIVLRTDISVVSGAADNNSPA